MRSRSPHLLPGQSPARQAQLLSSSPLESWHDEIAQGGVFSADKLAALFLALGLFFSQLAFVATPAAEASGSSPTLDPIGDQSVTLGDTLAFTATASDADSGESLSFSLDGEPAGATIDSVTGDFSWTPAATGAPTFDVVVTDEATLSLPAAGGWSYQQRIGISPATPSANYQVQLTLTPATFAYGNAAVDGADLRFFQADGTPLDYWIESWNPAGDSIVWVEVQTAATSSIYVRYGNGGAAVGSSGPATFLFFDDFESGIGSWTEGSGCSVSTAVDPTDGTNTVLVDGAGGGGWVTADTPGDTGWTDYAVRQRFRAPSADNYDHSGLIARWDDDGNMLYGGIHDPAAAGGPTNIELWNRVGGIWQDQSGTPDSPLGGPWQIADIGTTWHTQELRIDGDQLSITIDGSLIGNAPIRPDAPIDGKSGFWCQYGPEGHRDDHIVRAFDSAFESAVSISFGTEHTAGAFPANEDRETITVTVSGVNSPPSADAGGPYSIGEGEDLVLDGSGSSDPDTDPLTYNWDIDNDGQYDDATGVNPTVPWLTLVGLGFDDDGGSYPIGLEVDDGTDTDTATVNWTIVNTPPTITVTGSGTVGEGSVYTANLAVTDPGADTVTQWIINWGDGTIDTLAGNPASATHTYVNPGEYNITASVADEDGTWTEADLFVPSFVNGSSFLGRYDGTAGAFVTDLGGGSPLTGGRDAVIGPDGLLYVASYWGSAVLRFDPATDSYVDAFVASGSGGLGGPSGLTFGPDGNLYVSDYDTNSVRRYDGTTGASLGTFVTAGSGSLTQPAGLTFGPDDNLYVVSYDGMYEVKRYNGTTGAYIDNFVGVIGSFNPEDLEFGPDGNLYVAFHGDDKVRRFNGTTGAYINDFVTAGSGGLNGPTGLGFGPDGDLYVSSDLTDSVKRYDGTTGAYIDNFVSAGSGGLDRPFYATFLPDHQVTVSAVNSPPSADAGGPYSIGEGEDLVLDGSGSSDPDTDPLTYAWDIDNDGQYDDATGPNPTVAWLTLVGLGFDDDGGPYPIGLEVDDGNGHTDTATVNWTISNTPPTISVTGSGTVGAGLTYTATLSVSDPGNDTVTGWTINWGDGNIDTIPGNPASATHTYANPGEYNITAAVADEDSLLNRPWHNGRMVVPGLFANEQLFRLEATSGAVVDNLASGNGQGWAITAIIGPDGLAYVGDYTNDTIRRYNPATGADLGVWIAAGTGGLDGPAGMQFGPDGHLYVASNFSDQILEFDTDGTFLGVFASGGGLDEPDDLTFGPDGHLYVTSFHTDEVLKYNGRDGHPMGVFASGPEMNQPSELVFGPGGKLYVTSVANDQVVRYNADGTLDTIFATAGATGLNEPRGAAFGPDGHLYVGGRNRIVRYDGSSGALIDVYLPSGSINGPAQSVFIPAHRVTALPLIVNSTGDGSDNNPGDGVCYTGGINSETNPECTLRAAIEEANAFPGTDTINFDMPAGESGHSGGVWTIGPISDFDQLTGTVIIDGTTQPGWTTTPVVEINGSGAASDGFRIVADDVEIHGLAINRFPGDGIEVAAGVANTVIAANHIGVDATGLVDRGNTGRGIYLAAGSSATRVGGGEIAHRNVISGNGSNGMVIASSSANTIFNNFIGTDITGNVPIGNGADGIYVGGTSGSNIIGQLGDFNVISGNANDGVENDATGANNAVYYNIIGLGVDGATTVPNGRHGVVIYDGANNTFVYQNLIAGNTESGVVIDGNGNAATANNNIIGNWIGINVANQPRPNGSHGVDIFGGATGNAVGGTLAAYRNIISGNGIDGIRIEGSATSGNRVENNHIGTNIAGDAAVANGNNGVFIVGAPSNTVGGLTANHRNVISGNGNNGILFDAATATGNTIQGNYVGLNAAGDAAVPNADEGVDLSDAPGNLVGGDTAGARNVISGNGQDGVLLIGADTTGNFVSGNYIGTNAAGDAAVPNGRTGVYVDNAAATNDIGGATSDWGNVISGNTEDGIYLTDNGTDLNRITFNYIGTNAAGDAAVPNGDRGVQVESGASFTWIGDVGQGNVISGNTGDGIIIADFLSLGTSDNYVIENLIGVAADGTTPLGNGANGVHIDPVADTLIATNTIAHNAWDGVLLEPTSLTGNSIVGNSIHSNGQLGIDLGNDGPTINDGGDGDTGPNNLLNYPVIDSAVIAPPWITVNYTIDAPSGNYVVHFFSNPSGTDPSGYGEGEAFEYQDPIAHPGGSASYIAVFSGFVTDELTATLTEGVVGTYGSTSEFSPVAQVFAGTLVVNSGGNAGDATPGDGSCDTSGTIVGGDPECTLHAAIQEANALGGSATIEFAIPDTDPLYRNLGAGLSYWRIQPTVSVAPITASDITIDATTQTSFATAQGYFVNATGPEVEINGSSGVGGNGLELQSSNNEIRGFVINRFDSGIAVLSGDANVIAGNYLGPDPTGANGQVGNWRDGIEVDGATNTVVGGSSSADRNVISGNRLRGVLIDTDSPLTAGTQVLGNYVGTNAAGDAALLYDATNTQQIGVYILNSPDTVVGAPGDGNVISGNSWFGIYGWGPSTTGLETQDNVIGLDASATNPVPNATDPMSPRSGIYLSSIPGALIGGTAAGEGNVIAGNAEFGVVLYAAAATSTTVIGNQIYGNADIGIDLDGDGVSANGPGDPLNYPEITSATENAGTVTVDFDLDVPAGDYRIEFFANPSGADPSGYGEGEAFVDYYNIVGHPGGSASYSTTFPGSTGDIITSTTTQETGSPFGSTSEFSAAVPVTLADTTPPVITLLGANPQTIEAGDPYVELGATALDDIDGDISGSIVVDASGVDTSTVGSYSVTYNVSDSAGNAAVEVARTVDVVDTTAPVITLVGVNPQTIEAGDPYVELGATAFDIGDGDLTASIVIDASGVDTSTVGSYAVTYNVADSYGNAAVEVTRTVDVVDTTAPVIALIGPNPQVVEVGDPYSEFGAVAFDAGDGDLSASIVIDASAVDTSTVGSYPVTYNVSDSSGNAATEVTRTVNVVDTTAPVITLLGANPQTVEVGDPYLELGATAFDVGDGDLTASIVIDASGVDTSTVGSYSVTYNVSDSQGNAATEAARTINVVDTTAPVITLLGANPQTAEAGDPYVELGATAFDIGDGDLTGAIVIDASAVDTGTVGSYAVTYNVSDSSGNAATEVTRTVDVVDTTAPVIALIGPNPQNIEVGDPYSEFGAVAFDAGDGDLSGAIVIDASGVDTSTVGSYSVTYNVSDSSGNAATEVVRTVNVVDTTAPVISLVGANPQTIEVGDPYVELGATAFDVGDGDLTGSIVIDATGVNTGAIGSYTVTYNVSDSQGNAAIEVTRTVDVVDTTAPVITLLGSNPQQIEAGAPYVELGATAFDVGDGDLSGSIVIDASGVDTSTVGSYAVTYNVSDSQGNAATEVTRTVDVIDTTAPVITLLGANPHTIEAGTPYVELGATAFDAGDGDLTASIIIDSSGVDTAAIGSYTVTYDVTDSQGYPATQMVRTVNVADTTAPVITVLGADLQTIEVGDPYLELGATATDSLEGDLTASIVIDTSGVDTSTVGSYTVTYNVTDSQGNAATQVMRTVDVVDTTAPVITLLGVNPQIIEVGDPYAELGATAFDIGDGDLTGAIVIDASAVNTGAVGSYTVTYNVADSQGNAATQMVRTVNVVDTTAPVITLVGTNLQTIDVGSPYAELGATAFDIHDGDISASIVIDSSAVNTAVVGTYIVTYNVSDSQGNAATQVTRTVDVINVAPTLDPIGAQAGDEEAAITFTATASDPDPADNLSFGLAGEPVGAAIDPSIGVFTWTPTEAQGPGVYTFDVVVTDSGTPGLTGSETITITVTEVNLAPSLTPVAPQAGAEQSPITFSVPAGDPDIPGNVLTFILSGAPAGASIDPATGDFTWTPAEAQGPGVYTFDLSVSDNGVPSLGDTTPVTITVTEVNAAPVVTDPGDQFSAEAETLSLFIAATDTDIPANSLSYNATGLPDGLTIDSATGQISGTIDYTANAASPFTTTVTVIDDGTPTESGQVSFTWTVSDTNRAPVGVDDIYTIVEDGSGLFDVAANDSDPDGDPATVIGVGTAGNGTTLLDGGQIRYIPAADYSGTDTFTYTITDGRGGMATATVDVTVSPVNDTPVLSGLASMTVAELNAATFTVNATDVEADGVTFSLAGAPTGATINAITGAFAWTPTEAQGPGTYTFDVVGTDDGVPAESGSHQVQIAVTEINAAPTITNPGTQFSSEADVVSLQIAATDPDIPATTMQYSASGLPPGLGIDVSSGVISGILPFSAAGSSPYSVTVAVVDDGVPQRGSSTTFTWIVDNINRAPVADDLSVNAQAGIARTVTLTGTDPDGDGLTYSIASQPAQGTLTGGPQTLAYAPDVTAGGSDTFTFTVSDGSLSATGTVTITITPNDPPVGGADEYVTRRGGTLTVAAPGILVNDRDPEGLPITPTLVTAPAHGTLSIAGDGSFEYNNDGSAADLDTFSYRLNDGMRDSSVVTVRIIVDENAVPVAVDDFVSGDEDETIQFNPVGNDSDPNNEPVTVVGATEPPHGNVTWTSDGAFTYQPDRDWNGTDTFLYEISDGDLMGIGRVTVTIRPVNDRPVATIANATGDSGSVMTVDLTPYVSDVDGDPLTFLLESPPNGAANQVQPGIFEINLDGVIQDLPPLAYVVTDTSGARATALLKVSVAIPAELVGVPALVGDDINAGALQDGELPAPPGNGDTSLVAGLRLMIGSVLGTFQALRVPSLLLVLFVLVSLYLGLSKKFVFSSTATALPFIGKRKVDVIMAPSQAGVPVREEAGSHQSVLTRFAPDEVNITATGARVMVRSEVWIEVETPEADGWVDAEFLTEQYPSAAFFEDERPPQLIAELVDNIYDSSDLLQVTDGHDLHVAHYGPPVRFAASSLRRLLSGASVYWWWGADGDTPSVQATFAEVVGESFAAAYRNRGAYRVDPVLPIPVEFVNMNSLVVGHPERGPCWRVFFRYEDGEPAIVGLMREAAFNPAAMHGMTVAQ